MTPLLAATAVVNSLHLPKIVQKKPLKICEKATLILVIFNFNLCVIKLRLKHCNTIEMVKHILIVYVQL